ncbi:hypothetical protein V498_05586 [Pseudogymnoascus sp. VKM F-4517 (FW-2822)]|nr:hypothetical protein V498_05586 [Pseudogymnoascus sp. VKM F-4517 (FW-2822)]
MLEQQVYSVEAANINRETLAAMEKAGQAMKQTHGKLNIDIVDQTMEDFREGYAMGEEIAITYSSPGETIDETELDDELAKMEQEQLDDKMLKMGTVPVADEVHRLPAAVNGEHESSPPVPKVEHGANALAAKNKLPANQEEDDEEEELRKLQAEMAM